MMRIRHVLSLVGDISVLIVSIYLVWGFVAPLFEHYRYGDYSYQAYLIVMTALSYDIVSRAFRWFLGSMFAQPVKRGR